MGDPGSGLLESWHAGQDQEQSPTLSQLATHTPSRLAPLERGDPSNITPPGISSSIKYYIDGGQEGTGGARNPEALQTMDPN